jgi:hypothetical protein
MVPSATQLGVGSLERSPPSDPQWSPDQTNRQNGEGESRGRFG